MKDILNQILELANEFSNAKDLISVDCSSDELENLELISNKLVDKAKESVNYIPKESSIEILNSMNICSKQKRYVILAFKEV